jgi:hypothetical protein
MVLRTRLRQWPLRYVISAWEFKISVNTRPKRRSIEKCVHFKNFALDLANFIIDVFMYPIIGKFPSSWKNFSRNPLSLFYKNTRKRTDTVILKYVQCSKLCMSCKLLITSNLTSWIDTLTYCIISLWAYKFLTAKIYWILFNFKFSFLLSA